MNTPAYFLNRVAHRLKYNVGRVQKELGLELDRYGCQLTNDISYYQETSRHRQVMPLYEAIP